MWRNDRGEDPYSYAFLVIMKAHIPLKFYFILKAENKEIESRFL